MATDSRQIWRRFHLDGVYPLGSVIVELRFVFKEGAINRYRFKIGENGSSKIREREGVEAIGETVVDIVPLVINLLGYLNVTNMAVENGSFADYINASDGCG